MSGRHLLVAAEATVLAGCVLLALVVILIKVVRGERRRRHEAALRPIRPALIEVASGEDEDGSARRALTATTGATRAAVDEGVADFLAKVRGGPADQLVEILRSHGALREAVRLLRHRSPVRRTRAALLLGLSRDSGGVPGLVEALDDHSAEVRSAAAHGLGLIGDDGTAPALLAAIAGPSGGIPAGVAAEALLELGVGIAPALREALASTDSRTRAVAAHVAGVGSFRSLLPLLRDLLARDEDLTVREASAEAIGAMGEARDVEVLTRHTTPAEPTPLRRLCATALGRLGEPAAVPTLEQLARDPDPRLAELAATALVGLGPEGRAALAGLADTPGGATALTLARLQGALA